MTTLVPASQPSTPYGTPSRHGSPTKAAAQAVQHTLAMACPRSCHSGGPSQGADWPPNGSCSRPLCSVGAACGSSHCSGCATAGRGRHRPPAAVSLCCPGYPPASCCPHPLSTRRPYLYGPLRTGSHCGARGGCGHQRFGPPAGHGGASLGGGGYLSGSCRHRLTPGCHGCLPARTQWSGLPPATVRPGCCPAYPPAHGGGAFPSGGHQCCSPSVTTLPCRHPPATAHPDCCPIC